MFMVSVRIRVSIATVLSVLHHSDKFKQKIGTVCSIRSSRDFAFASEDFQKGAKAGVRVAVTGQIVAVWSVTATRQLCPRLPLLPNSGA